jgi:hypothetical protein
MNRILLYPNSSEVESLLAVERDVVSEPDDVRHRVIERARGALPRNLRWRLAVRAPSPRPIGKGLAAAAAIILPTLCAAAFIAGYGIRSRNAETLARVAPLTPSLVAPHNTPSPSVVVALVPVASTSIRRSTSSEAELGSPRQGRIASAGTAKSAIDVETYAKELRVLQPARQAVARQDFAAALSAVEEHQHVFPSGRLTEEREALRIKALLGLGRVAEAEHAAAAFRARFPRSVLVGRIDEMLGTKN